MIEALFGAFVYALVASMLPLGVTLVLCWLAQTFRLYETRDVIEFFGTMFIIAVFAVTYGIVIFRAW